jgi:hypothetical protein
MFSPSQPTTPHTYLPIHRKTRVARATHMGFCLTHVRGEPSFTLYPKPIRLNDGKAQLQAAWPGPISHPRLTPPNPPSLPRKRLCARPPLQVKAFEAPSRRTPAPTPKPGPATRASPRASPQAPRQLAGPAPPEAGPRTQQSPPQPAPVPTMPQPGKPHPIKGARRHPGTTRTAPSPPSHHKPTSPHVHDLGSPPAPARPRSAGMGGRSARCPAPRSDYPQPPKAAARTAMAA